MKSFNLDLPSRGGAVHCLEWGPADRAIDIVFIHANGFNARTYAAILEPLGSSLRVVAFDQRGHGRTTLPTPTVERGDWLDLRDDAVAVCDALKIEGAVLAGHSMGGTAAILAASAEPRLARAVVAFDPVIMRADAIGVQTGSPMITAALRRRAIFPDRETVARSYRGRGAFTSWPDEMLEDYLTDGLRELPTGEVALACKPSWEASNYAAHAHDPRAAIRGLRCPLRIFTGETGSTCSLTSAEADALGEVALGVVPGTTHFLPMERPDVVREALKATAD